ncbi:MAG: hypothetical protein ICV85_12720, partial [Tolypothrix sp. T3-bin4]|nr:hypothetical protein [Tolypothrix sp. T3-bin4]
MSSSFYVSVVWDLLQLLDQIHTFRLSVNLRSPSRSIIIFLSLYETTLLVAQDRGVGNAGNITIDSNSLSVTNGARLISSTEQQGNAGNITIDSNSLLVTNGA